MKQLLKKMQAMRPKNFTNEKVRELVRNFPIDNYRDENGVIRCPVPKADREALMAKAKKLAMNNN